MKTLSEICNTDQLKIFIWCQPLATWEFILNIATAVGGLVALFVAVSTYLRNSRTKREAQARLVYSKIEIINTFDKDKQFLPLTHGGISTSTGAAAISNNRLGGFLWSSVLPVYQVKVIVCNKSEELIGPVKVQMINSGNGKTWNTFSILIGTIEPNTNSEVEFVWENDVFPNQYGLMSTIIFRDSNSSWWRRKGSDPIEKVHNDPENSCYTPWERELSAKRAEALGWIPSQEPRLPFRVKYNRLLRRLKGKPPIP